MKHQYFGDVNDYVKYALLRRLIRDARLTICACWMMTLDDQRGDGRLTGYLSDSPRWRAGDPELFDHLDELIAAGARSVRHIEQGGWLPGARCFADTLADEAQPRRLYMDRLWPCADGADLMFFDPDNGCETRSTPYGRRGSSRYLYWHEIAEAYRRGHSVLAFQHFPRVQRGPYLRRLLASLARITGCTPVMCLVTPRVAYLAAAQPRHAAELARTLGAFARHWRPILRTVRVLGLRRRSGIPTRATAGRLGEAAV